MPLRFIPNPLDDTIDDCEKHGWRFIEDLTEEAKLFFQSMSSEERIATLGRIASRAENFEPTFLFLPDGIFAHALEVPNKGWMLLTQEAVNSRRVTLGGSYRN